MSIPPIQSNIVMTVPIVSTVSLTEEQLLSLFKKDVGEVLPDNLDKRLELCLELSAADLIKLYGLLELLNNHQMTLRSFLCQFLLQLGIPVSNLEQLFKYLQQSGITKIFVEDLKKCGIDLVELEPQFREKYPQKAELFSSFKRFFFMYSEVLPFSILSILKNSAIAQQSKHMIEYLSAKTAHYSNLTIKQAIILSLGSRWAVCHLSGIDDSMALNLLCSWNRLLITLIIESSVPLSARISIDEIAPELFEMITFMEKAQIENVTIEQLKLISPTEEIPNLELRSQYGIVLICCAQIEILHQSFKNTFTQIREFSKQHLSGRTKDPSVIKARGSLEHLARWFEIKINASILMCDMELIRNRLIFLWDLVAQDPFDEHLLPEIIIRKNSILENLEFLKEQGSAFIEKIQAAAKSILTKQRLPGNKILCFTELPIELKNHIDRCRIHSDICSLLISFVRPYFCDSSLLAVDALYEDDPVIPLETSTDGTVSSLEKEEDKEQEEPSQTHNVDDQISEMKWRFDKVLENFRQQSSSTVLSHQPFLSNALSGYVLALITHFGKDYTRVEGMRKIQRETLEEVKDHLFHGAQSMEVLFEALFRKRLGEALVALINLIIDMHVSSEQFLEMSCIQNNQARNCLHHLLKLSQSSRMILSAEEKEFLRKHCNGLLWVRFPHFYIAHYEKRDKPLPTVLQWIKTLSAENPPQLEELQDLIKGVFKSYIQHSNLILDSSVLEKPLEDLQKILLDSLENKDCFPSTVSSKTFLALTSAKKALKPKTMDPIALKESTYYLHWLATVERMREEYCQPNLNSWFLRNMLKLDALYEQIYRARLALYGIRSVNIHDLKIYHQALTLLDDKFLNDKQKKLVESLMQGTASHYIHIHDGKWSSRLRTSLKANKEAILAAEFSSREMPQNADFWEIFEGGIQLACEQVRRMKEQAENKNDD